MIDQCTRLFVGRIGANVACFALLATSAVCAAEPRAATPENDLPSIVGTWLVTGHTFCGKPSKDRLDSVYVFHDDQLLEIYAPTFEARFKYRIVRPGVLEWSFAGDEFSNCGIYRFDGDALVWRVAREEQLLDFDSPPKGKWNEYRMKRVQGKEADKAIAKMKDSRLANKAHNSDDEIDEE